MFRNHDRRGFLKVVAAVGAGLGVSVKSYARKSGMLQTTDEMPIFEVFKHRRSVRKYKPTPVPEADIRKILDAARMAPTAGNQQPWRFLVVRDRTTLDRLKDACITRSLEGYKQRENPTEEELQTRKERAVEYFSNVLSAPVYIVVLIDTQSRYPSYNRHDGPLAAGYLMLAARALGYGTVYFTDSIPDEVTKEVLRIPDRYERVCITPVGVPDEWPETPDKKGLDDLVAHETIS